MREQVARIRRLSLWLCLNLLIFVACYLNYQLQLKHRYLYRTLNVGLCLSRAAAMVINLNLLLVWLPMCKYSLTRLAYLANGSLRRHRQRQHKLQMLLYGGGEQPQSQQQHQLESSNGAIMPADSISSNSSSSSNSNGRLIVEINSAAGATLLQLEVWLNSAKINSINSFLIAVDHCKSLHTICATTITIASVIHTVAHLLNVINFSEKFDPLLGNLNMAAFKGQNPLQLLISVPGITGVLMIIILILMSLSSIDLIRNSSYDLFQIFHRLSIVFVILLFLHPSSHVLKEQSNVSRHHPELCYSKMILQINRQPLSSNENLSVAGRALVASPSEQTTGANSTTTATSLSTFVGTNESAANKGIVYNQEHNYHRHHHQGQFNSSTATELHHKDNHHVNVNDLNNVRGRREIRVMGDSSGSISRSSRVGNVRVLVKSDTTTTGSSQTRVESGRGSTITTAANATTITTNNTGAISAMQNAEVGEAGSEFDDVCLDSRPLFVAQSSICWYVLSAGLSCYLLDLSLRKLRRSKSSIQLLDVGLDCEGNLIELILSSNHKRFAHWMPGQFVYLNCPQITTFEWHPFTISSMDNKSRRFTLHIKTGGDWTRKLRERLERGKYSMSLSSSQLKQHQPLQRLLCNELLLASSRSNTCVCSNKSSSYKLDEPMVPNLLNCYNPKTGQVQIECTNWVRIASDGSTTDQSRAGRDCVVEIDSSTGGSASIRKDRKNLQEQQQQKQLYSVCGQVASKKGSGSVSVSRCSSSDSGLIACKPKGENLNLFIDGPFHSPFERLLEQKVSVCISNGVGWTAFSSAFQCITNNFAKGDDGNKDWWTKWGNFAVSQSRCSPFEATGDSVTIQTPTTLPPSSTSKSSKIKKLSETKLHLMVIVTSIEQLKPFYNLARDYFDRIQADCQIQKLADQINPVREITAFITRSTEEDDAVKEFCVRDNLSNLKNGRSIRVNDVFTIHFGKPNFDHYLNALSKTYSDSGKISVYCCGSYQVKKEVREICLRLNKMAKSRIGHWSVCSYHEESF